MNGLKSSWTEQTIWVFNVLIIENFSFSGAMEELSSHGHGGERRAGGQHGAGTASGPFSAPPWILYGAVDGWTVLLLQSDN